MTVYGTDPEFFAGYTKDDKIFALPPIFFRKELGVKATKDPRHPVFLKVPEYGAIVHEDGAAFEMSIEPSTMWRSLFAAVNETKRVFEKEVLGRFDDCLPNLLALPTINWEIERWKNEGEDFFMSTRFGCDPDWDAFHYVPNESVEDASQHPYRYGGGHIHFSGVAGFKDAPLLAVHCLAFTAGLAGTAYSVMPELDKLRTHRYGKPGKFRPQKYKGLWNNIPDSDFGVEYRTLSNLWTSDASLAEKVFQWANIGIEVLFGKRVIDSIFSKISGDVQKAIVSCDQKLAGELLSYLETVI